MEEYRFTQNAPEIQETLNQVATNTEAIASANAKIQELKNEIDGMSGNVIYDQDDLIKNHFYDVVDSPVPTKLGKNDRFACIQLTVNAGDNAIVTTYGGPGKGRAYALTDRERNVLAVADPDTILSAETVTANVDGFLMVNCKAEYISAFRIELNKEQTTQSVSLLSINPTINLKKVGLRVLDIGNSFTADSTHYMNEIVAAAGISPDFSFYKALRGGGCFKTWYDVYNDQDTKEYGIYKQFGDDVPGVQLGTSSGDNGTLFRTALFAGWDLVIIRTRSEYATDYSQWSGTSEAGYLKEFIRIIRKSNPNATIGYAAIHSLSSTHPNNTEHSSEERWRKQMASCRQFMADYGINFIVPYGTAVQNLRASSLNDGSDFSEDGRHMADGIGDYVASCAYFQALVAPRYGINIIGNSWTKTDFDESITGVINITAANALLAQKAAFASCCDMFNINNPDTLEYHDDTSQTTQDYPDPVAILKDSKADKPLSGTFANKPTTGLYVGMMYFNITAHKPIYYGGNSKWYDSDGVEQTE